MNQSSFISLVLIPIVIYKPSPDANPPPFLSTTHYPIAEFWLYGFFMIPLVVVMVDFMSYTVRYMFFPSTEMRTKDMENKTIIEQVHLYSLSPCLHMCNIVYVRKQTEASAASPRLSPRSDSPHMHTTFTHHTQQDDSLLMDPMRQRLSTSSFSIGSRERFDSISGSSDNLVDLLGTHGSPLRKQGSFESEHGGIPVGMGSLGNSPGFGGGLGLDDGGVPGALSVPFPRAGAADYDDAGDAADTLPPPPPPAMDRSA
jgi:hypothetical protein